MMSKLITLTTYHGNSIALNPKYIISVLKCANYSEVRVCAGTEVIVFDVTQEYDLILQRINDC